MTDMIDFCSAILDAICAFLGTPPIFYLFALVCFAAIISMVRTLLKFDK